MLTQGNTSYHGGKSATYFSCLARAHRFYGINSTGELRTSQVMILVTKLSSTLAMATTARHSSAHNREEHMYMSSYDIFHMVINTIRLTLYGICVCMHTTQQ